MSQEVLCEATIDALRNRHPAYHETAYLFVLSGLHHTIDRLREPRHISGRELAEGCRELALERYGPMARSVLAFWGIRSTRDLGQVVFALVDCGILVKQPHDDVSDFAEVFDFADLDGRYPWTVPSPLAR